MNERIASVALHIVMVLGMTAFVCSQMPKRPVGLKAMTAVQWSVK